ncbi:MAG TPA: MlaD family protein [Solirubrobacteraceae bacterium]|nr:MlaD family protein [Solirubrobacteraceae bacterium]
MQLTGSHRPRRVFHWVLDHPWYLLLIVGVIVFVNWVISTRQEPYIVKAAFTSGFNMVSGLPVDVNGIQVGKIAGVTYDGSVAGGEAIVSVGITNPAYIPLHRGTVVEARWGSTIGNETRRLDVTPGATSAPKIPNQGIIETNDTIPAQDVDQELNVFSAKTRQNLTSMLGHFQGSFQGQASYLHAGINSAPAALNAANGVLSDLNSDQYALRGLITNGNTLTSVLANRAQGISDLVTVAGNTFATMSDHANGLQQSIADLPGALTEARGTLARLNTSVGVLRGLITDIRPGAAQLAPLATAMVPTLASLHSIVPLGDATLTEATSDAPSITKLLSVATPFMPKVSSVTSQLAPMVACIRPFTPEGASGLVNAGEWMSTYTLEKPSAGLVTYLGQQVGPFVEQHGVRAMPEASLTSDHAYPQGLTTKTFINISHKGYAFPRSPGQAVDQPWYQPQCGDSPNSVNPADDPENPTK